ncbi:cytochrome P450 [Vitiosangium sp. GDMCC 1.1324]|nr:cytochrome P450 [Vitiosangium sp. GDMCC 1.1324]
MLMNPYPLYAALRETAAVQKVEALLGAYVISRHEHIGPVLKNTAVFSSVLTGINGLMSKELGEDVLRYFRPENNLIASDPPLHTRLRTLVSRAFTPRRIAELEPRIRELSRELIDAMLAREEFDLISDLAAPLPVIVIAEMLGIEPERRLDFKRWSDNVIQVLATVGDMGTDMARVGAGLRELHTYLEGAIEQRRRAPRSHDLISALIEASASEGGLLSTVELIGFVRLLLIAGNETTTHLIGNGTVALLRHPAEMARLAAEASLIPNAVEEMLRYDGPVQAILRVTTRDTEVAGHPIPKDSRVMLLIGAANRDPRKFPEPDRFDATRDTQGQLGFGHGIHFCLGAPLARLEAKVVFEEIFRRARSLSFAPGHENRIPWSDTFMVRGPKALRLRAERR